VPHGVTLEPSPAGRQPRLRIHLRFEAHALAISRNEITVARKAKAAVNEGTDATPVDAIPSTGKPFTRRKSNTAAKKRSLKSVPQTKKAAAAKAAPAPLAKAEPTDDEIRLRAYFISERRHRLALPGDSNEDWIEARRQLMAEAGLE
jgi:hypothetical protein